MKDMGSNSIRYEMIIDKNMFAYIVFEVKIVSSPILQLTYYFPDMSLSQSIS